jgi:hypothetical protein
MNVLQARFEKNMDRHKNLTWNQVQERLEQLPKTLWSLSVMEDSAMNRMLWDGIERAGPLFSLIVPRRA